MSPILSQESFRNELFGVVIDAAAYSSGMRARVDGLIEHDTAQREEIATLDAALKYAREEVARISDELTALRVRLVLVTP